MNNIKVDKTQQIEKIVTPIRGFACFSQWHYAQSRLILP